MHSTKESGIASIPEPFSSGKGGRLRMVDTTDPPDEGDSTPRRENHAYKRLLGEEKAVNRGDEKHKNKGR